jgi:hypothetical protein
LAKFPLFNIQFPLNAEIFYKLINDVANFDILPTEKIMSSIFNFTETSEQDRNFREMGYET